MTVTLCNPVDQAKVDFIYGCMQNEGRPVIQVTECDGVFYALEGSHRLVAAHQNNIKPIFEIVDCDDVPVAEYGVDYYEDVTVEQWVNLCDGPTLQF